ncbi:MAG: ribonuclease T2 [Hyphomicrobiaceae bacterium]
MRRLTALATALVLAIGIGPASAQSGKAGVFDYYTLVMSWSPTFCEGRTSTADGPQCSGARPYAFVLHGLWPQYEKGYPESCRIGKKPWVPGPVIDGMLDIMPSPKLVIHEYKKHGTCSGLDPNGYFAMARKLYSSITVPPAFVAPLAEITTSAAEIEAAFLKANPALTPEMISVACGKRDRVREVRICFTREGTLRSCGRNEAQERLCRASKITMPPVRGKGQVSTGSSTEL